VSFYLVANSWRPPGVEVAGLQPPPRNRKLKNADLVDTIISNVLRYLLLAEISHCNWLMSGILEVLKTIKIL
jgi:hypothetical protein